MMPRTFRDRTFLIEIEVTARAFMSHGGSSSHDSDDPPWSEIDDIEIDYIEIFGHKIVGLNTETKSALIEAAYEEFAE
jgi:hypothetical protein